MTLPEDEDRPEMKCALKVVDASELERDWLKRLLKKIEIQTTLKHITIMPLVGLSFPSKKDDNYSILTRLMPNLSLQNLLEKVRKGQSPDRWETIKAVIVFGIAAGMAYIHQNGIIHKDLKPENILLDENFRPKIIGFGIAEYLKPGEKILSDSTGTVFYIPPESLTDSNSISHKHDVYSYSILLYELLTEKRPFEEIKNVFQYINKVSQGFRPPIADDEIPASFKTLINQCWMENPDDRPSSVEIVKKLRTNKNEFFNFDLINEQEFNEYVEQAIQDLDLS